MGCVRREVAQLIDAARLLWCDEEAVTTIEYVLLLSVLILGIMVAFGSLSENVGDVATKSSCTLDGAAMTGSGYICPRGHYHPAR